MTPLTIDRKLEDISAQLCVLRAWGDKKRARLNGVNGWVRLGGYLHPCLESKSPLPHILSHPQPPKKRALPSQLPNPTTSAVGICINFPKINNTKMLKSF